MLTEFHIGIDDTDSDKGGCTTYTATVLFQELIERGFKPSDFPWLVRLNPNIPWKTRGNGALAVHFFVEEDQIEDVQRVALETVEETTVASTPGTDAAVAFLKGQVPRALRKYSTRALHDVLTVREARAVATKAGAEVHAMMGVQGVIGSLAAIGVGLEPHQSGVLTGRVDEMPRVLRGGHVIFRLRDDSGLVDCAVYQPTGSLAMAARDLLPGDRVRASGGIRGWREGRPTLNLEKLEVLHLVEKIQHVNPTCSNCGGRCESMGRGQGLRCKKCGQQNENAAKILVRQQRHLQLTIYVPPPRARRHLTMPDSKPRNISNEYLRVEDFQLRVEDFN